MGAVMAPPWLTVQKKPMSNRVKAIYKGIAVVYINSLIIMLLLEDFTA